MWAHPTEGMQVGLRGAALPSLVTEATPAIQPPEEVHLVLRVSSGGGGGHGVEEGFALLREHERPPQLHWVHLSRGMPPMKTN